jgi:hypothetical protein
MYFTLLLKKNITLTVGFYWSIALLEPKDKNQKLKPSFSVIKHQALWFHWSSRFIQIGQSESNYAMFGCQHFNLLKQKDFPSATWLNRHINACTLIPYISYHIYSPSVDLYRYGIHHTVYISMQGICHNTTIQ